MEVYQLPYGRLKILQKDIAEINIDEAVHMDKAMLDKYYHFLITHLEAPFSILLNSINKNSYSHVLGEFLAALKETNVVAYATHKVDPYTITMDSRNDAITDKWNFKIFSNRQKALDWLRQEQEFIHLQELNNKYNKTRF